MKNTVWKKKHADGLTSVCVAEVMDDDEIVIKYNNVMLSVMTNVIICER